MNAFAWSQVAESLAGVAALVFLAMVAARLWPNLGGVGRTGEVTDRDVLDWKENQRSGRER